MQTDPLIPVVKGYYDPVTCTISYVVHAKGELACAVIDPVLDFDPISGRTGTKSVRLICEYIETQGLDLQWILETHAHADHLSAAIWLRQQCGGKIAIGANIVQVFKHFSAFFNLASEPVGSLFDHLWQDEETFSLGSLNAKVLYTPGHTPACVSYIIGDTVFVGDTLFMPDYGTARTDFPGGDAGQLYDSIQRLFALKGSTRMFLCHDYPSEREPQWQTTVQEQRESNVLLNASIGKETFVQKRRQKDAELATPKLLLPALQVNIRAGRLPEPEENGIQYLKLPLNRI